MIALKDRQDMVRLIEQAHADGARLHKACKEAGIDVRTLQRWRAHAGLVHGDRRPDAVRPQPAHTLSVDERAQLVAVANAPRFADQPPARIVPALADEGIYLASESSFQRVLRAEGCAIVAGPAHRAADVSPPLMWRRAQDRSGVGI